MSRFTNGVRAELENFNPLMMILCINEIMRGKKEHILFVYQGKKFRLKQQTNTLIVDEVN